MNTLSPRRAVAVAALACGRLLADGELDATFAPTPASRFGWHHVWQLRALPDGVLIHGMDRTPVTRVRSDGTIDDGWSLYPGDAGFDTDLIPLADGGWGVATWPGQFQLIRGDGSIVPVRGLGNSFDGDAAFAPLPDGSLLTFASGIAARILPDGTLGHWPAAGLFGVDADPNQPSAFPSAPRVSAATGPSGEVFVVGRAWHVFPNGLGLFRYAPNGTFDATWRPGDEIALVDQQGYFGTPMLPAPGPDGSLVVAFEGVGTGLALTYRLVKIDPAGHVAWSREVGSGERPRAIVQPDSRILCAGSFTNWNGTPVTGLVRLTPDGELDPSFQVVLRNPQPAVEPPRVSAMSLDDDGNLYIYGSFDSVNGVDRPGLARLRAFTPRDTPPALDIGGSKPRVGIGETLVLSAKVDGHPAPALQWRRNGDAIPGATNRVLRWRITDAAAAGSFSLEATNRVAKTVVTPPPVAVATPTPRVLAPVDVASGVLGATPWPSQILSLPDGRVLVAGHSFQSTATNRLLACLKHDLTEDETFGENGGVNGVGDVESVELLADGGFRVSGNFARIAGLTGVGLVEFDAHGHRRDGAVPDLDVPHVTATLGLPDGGMLVAGLFNTVGGRPSYRLARLRADRTPDPAFPSPVPPYRVVDAMALDVAGRILIAGARVYRDTDGGLPGPFGVARLRGDGSIDPDFTRYLGPAAELAVERFGTIVVGPPMVRLGVGGGVAMRFETPRAFGKYLENGASAPHHSLVRTADGGIIHPVLGPQTNLTERTARLGRWLRDGGIDELFVPGFDSDGRTFLFGTAACMEADGSVLFAYLAGVKPDGEPFQPRVDVLRFAADPEAHPRVRVTDGTLRATIPTRPGGWYDLESRRTPGGAALPGSPPQAQGDGYAQDFAVPAAGDAGFLRIDRAP